MKALESGVRVESMCDLSLITLAAERQQVDNGKDARRSSAQRCVGASPTKSRSFGRVSHSSACSTVQQKMYCIEKGIVCQQQIYKDGKDARAIDERRERSENMR